MRWFELRSRALSDDEYIEHVRKNLRVTERWRPWIIAGYGGCIALVGFVAIPGTHRLLSMAMDLTALGTPLWSIMAGFFSGVGFGLVLVMLLWMATAGIAFALMPLRTDRLLLQYYDAVQAHRDGEQRERDPSARVDGRG